MAGKGDELHAVPRPSTPAQNPAHAILKYFPSLAQKPK